MASEPVSVRQLPRANGKGAGGVHEGGGVPAKFEFRGRYAALRGAIWMRVIEPRNWGPEATLAIAVEEGRLRGYLGDPGGRGFRYIEATPGAPAQMTGHMILLHVYRFMLEAVSSDARGASYRIWR
jgi:hypothetical protein